MNKNNKIKKWFPNRSAQKKRQKKKKKNTQ